MSDKSKVEFIDNPNPIKNKVRVISSKEKDEILEKTEKKMDQLGGEFESIFEGEVKELAKNMAIAKKTPDEPGKAVEDIRRSLHDLRGQAGTFGYPLVSQVGDSACKFIDTKPSVKSAELTVLGVHIDALLAIGTTKIKGDGGAVGAELINGLRSVIQKYNKEHE